MSEDWSPLRFPPPREKRERGKGREGVLIATLLRRKKKEGGKRRGGGKVQVL